MKDGTFMAGIQKLTLAACLLVLSACGSLEQIREQTPVFDLIIEKERKSLISCMEKAANRAYGFVLTSDNVSGEVHKREDSLYFSFSALTPNKAQSTRPIILFDIEFEIVAQNRTRAVARVFRPLFGPNENEDHVREMLEQCR